jgi:hypothetical protein
MGAPAINAIPVRRRQPDDLIDRFRLTHTAEAWWIEKETVLLLIVHCSNFG